VGTDAIQAVPVRLRFPWLVLLCLLLVSMPLAAQIYSYDLDGRLTLAAYANRNIVNYAYDPAGNISRISTNAAVSTPPVLTIVSPLERSTVTNALLSLTGTASGNDRVVSVSYDVNNRPWQEASTMNAWTNWTASVTLAPGTNVLRAFATDANGYNSTTQTVSVLYLLPRPQIVGESLTANHGTLSFSWNGVAALTYQVQVSTNLASSPWVNLGNAIAPATNGPLTFSDAVSTNGQRFYRMVLSP